MTNRILNSVLCVLCALCVKNAVAADVSVSTDVEHSVLMRAMRDEMGRTMERLRMGDLEKPYFVSYTARATRRTTLRCDFGGLVISEENPDRSVKAEVRVGDAAFDNTHSVSADSWRYRPFLGDLPLEDDYDALRTSLWSLTDEAYKASLERLSQKRAYKNTKAIVEEIPDLSTDTASRTFLPLAAEGFDRKSWEGRVCELSRAFRNFPALQDSWVYLDVSLENRWYVDSQGGAYARPAEDIELQFGGSAQAADGMESSQTRRLLFRTISQLPALPKLAAEIEAFAAEMTAWARAPIQTEYVGPVLFEGEGAAEFFNQLLAHNVSNPRSLWLENEGEKKRFPTGALTGRTGLRVAPRFLDAVDDPAPVSEDGTPLAGHYVVDDEGMPAQAVRLIEKGRLRDVLMSRSPVKGHPASNGHARGGFWDLPTARPGTLFVSVSSGIPALELKRKFLDLVREAGLEYGLKVSRLAFEDQKGDDDLLSDPAVLLRVYPDGHEERVRDAEFEGVSLRALRDIVAASSERSVYNFYERGHLQGSRGELPASVVAPDILVEEMEFKKTEKKPEKRPYLKHPYFN